MRTTVGILLVLAAFIGGMVVMILLLGSSNGTDKCTPMTMHDSPMYECK